MEQSIFQSRIQTTFQSIRELMMLDGPDGYQRSKFVIQEEPTQQQIVVNEPEEVYSAAKLIDEIRQALLQSGGILIDLQGAERIHTAILQVLVAGKRACAANNRAFSIRGVASDVISVLELADIKMIDAI